MKNRYIERIIRGMPTSDGAGVRLTRSLGQTPFARLDPFLMLDEFASDNPDDYIAGFPPHPHRGFETVTYMLDGHMLHEDHLGNRGNLKSGGVQWMTAARGIIHSEMPQQESGRMHGFQLWVNLPAKEKMKDPSYRDIQAEDIPVVAFTGGSAHVIAGTLEVDGKQTAGAVSEISTQPLYFDVRLEADAAFTHAIPAGHNAFIYVYAGSLTAETDNGTGFSKLAEKTLGILSAGDSITVHAKDGPARFLLLAGKPLNEPVVQYGPFVMNSREEIEQAIHDYQAGTLASAASHA